MVVLQLKKSKELYLENTYNTMSNNREERLLRNKDKSYINNNINSSAIKDVLFASWIFFSFAELSTFSWRLVTHAPCSSNCWALAKLSREVSRIFKKLALYSSTDIPQSKPSLWFANHASTNLFLMQAITYVS